MEYTVEQINNAYIKLKSYIYYDNTDILLRKQLVEFETNKTKNINSLFGFSPKPYEFDEKFSIGQKIPVNKKLEVLTNMINSYHNSQKAEDFFQYLFNQLGVSFYPKKITQLENQESNFISNVRLNGNYELDRVNAFIKVPIEFHILSVLWIIEDGISLDSKLQDCCFGNRLLLNNDKDKIVQGSGLFKPYFKQYQRWRDDSVLTANELLEKDKNVLFVNLDIKDYFHSIRLDINKLNPIKRRIYPSLQNHQNMQDLMAKLHIDYTKLIAEKYKVPNDFYNQIVNNKGDIVKVILPIGLLSSYVLANDYLKEFDQNMLNNIKPAYYGRYVDDILIVISPSDLIDKIENSNDENENCTKVEKIIKEVFNSIIEIEKLDNKTTFKLKNFESLYCQSEKSLVYFFKHDESSLVIDKLKRELDERTSEFRDIPLDSEEDDSFEKNAYHLLYDNSEGKIRTLKDYKENRFGLSIYLSNKIFTALRHQSKLPENEIEKILKFFKGANCLEFYGLWEKIFTLFLVNKNPNAYVNFYLHCAQQIDKIANKTNNRKKTIKNTNLNYSEVKFTLIEYLDCAHELTLSLNPSFISKAKKASRNFEFQSKKLENSSYEFFFSDFSPSESRSFWIQRFREANFVRHKYIVQPLINYTEESKQGWADLTVLSFDFSKYKLNEELLKNSPRQIRFWECSMAYAYSEFEELCNNLSKNANHSILNFNYEENTNDFGNNSTTEKLYLDAVFELYKKVNSNHIPYYLLSDINFKNQIYTYNICKENNNSKLTEINVKTGISKISSPKIAFANTKVLEENIKKGIRGETNFSSDRYNKLALILKKARIENADILLFPEFFIPIELLSNLCRFSEKNQTVTITGLEHITLNKKSYNFVVNILPVEINGIKDSVVIFRLKNHYAHLEEVLIKGNHYKIPKPSPMRYDIINWNNIYLTTFYCFELANISHRSIVKGKIDLMIGIEFNKDLPYFSNIVEATSRDIHCYFAQANTSQYGDSRLTQPSKTAIKDLLRLKGGINDAILVAIIDLDKLREFQRTKFELSRNDDNFKPLPPDFKVNDVINRINNKTIL
ncbi:MAG: RNA-directed DNA polymerase [Gelidibacter sp.]|nr:RNA-directed DNA polymerase [Gelidibacter sp.]